MAGIRNGPKHHPAIKRARAAMKRSSSFLKYVFRFIFIYLNQILRHAYYYRQQIGCASMGRSVGSGAYKSGFPRRNALVVFDRSAQAACRVSDVQAYGRDTPDDEGFPDSDASDSRAQQYQNLLFSLNICDIGGKMDLMI